MFRPSTKNEWWLCGTLFVQAVITIALEIYILTEWQLWVTPTIIQVPVSYIVPVGLGILTFACVYEFILALEAIHHKNNILLLAICVSNVCSAVYAGILYSSMHDNVSRLYRDRHGYPTLVDPTYNAWPRIQPAEIAVPIVMGLCTLVLWPCAYYLHRQYSWAIYKCVNGSRETRIRYLAYEIYLVLLKLDFYFLIAFIIQYNLIDVHFEEPESSLTWALIPAALIVMILSIYSVRRERIWFMIPIIICYIGLIAYLLSRIVILNGHTFRANTTGKGLMMLFAIVALVLTTGALIVSVICMLNFNRGLKMVNNQKSYVARESYFTLGERSHSPSTSDIHKERRPSPLAWE
ncbi:hypothetical protein N7492_008891 [Penicillium capsulatum]|uniref:Uncharacterized protein n=1 Tax=Penicillium capsulatum TaxID=69766 RepID=A0A9W9LHD9_9EURO|nr:hypothetical protein N7492_008891 [Penicillium capsulatum]KAJ6106293.1 hypothetical protein N7512_009810 [Penicillium capsulatum]